MKGRADVGNDKSRRGEQSWISPDIGRRAMDLPYAVNREFRCMAGNAVRAQPNMAIRQTVLYTEPNGSV